MNVWCPFKKQIAHVSLCMDSQQILLGEAIKQMKLLTKKNISFSFSFTSYNEKKDTSDGVVKVHSAVLRKQHASHLLDYTDTMQQLPKRCHIALLMTFNDFNIKI